MLPVVDPEGSRTFRQILVTAAALSALAFCRRLQDLPESLLFRCAGLSVALCRFASGREREDK